MPDEARQSLSIVIPTFNEEENIGRVYERLSGILEGIGLKWELIFSVDPCTDRTVNKLETTTCHAEQ